MRKLLFALLCLVPAIIYGQENYYVIDSVSTVGVKMIEASDLMNSRICQVVINDKIKEYTPEQVSEYGFKSGRVYFSRKIQSGDSIKTVFLERLVKGNTNLYYYKGHGIKEFFLEKDSGKFIALPVRGREKKNNSFHAALTGALTECPEVVGYSNMVGYNKRSMSEFISGYNKCTPVPPHVFKYGLILGYDASKLVSSSNYDDRKLDYLNYKYEGSVAVGGFIDKPIMYSNFSAHLELYYSHKKYSYSSQNESEIIDMVANTSSLIIPALLRYTFRAPKTMPFINIGGCFAYNFESSCDIYSSTINNGTVQINGVTKSDIISKNQLGFSTGAGLEYRLSFKRSLSLELRCNRLVNLGDTGAKNISAFLLLTEINF
jgi:hypothetical protein